jgi:hypothetical protein
LTVPEGEVDKGEPECIWSAGVIATVVAAVQCVWRVSGGIVFALYVNEYPFCLPAEVCACFSGVGVDSTSGVSEMTDYG